MEQRKLCSKPHINEGIQAVRKYVSGKDENGMPRFGLLSLICDHTPFVVFDHESIAKDHKTAFTDYTHAWFNADFIEDLLVRSAEYARNGEHYDDVLFLVLHELDHIARRHNKRLTNHYGDVRAISVDVEINTGLLRNFERLKISPHLSNMGCGTSDEYRDKFTGFSAEAVFSFFSEEIRKKKEEQEQEQGQESEEGDTSDDSTQAANEGPGQENNDDNSEPEDGNDTGDDKGSGQPGDGSNGGGGNGEQEETSLEEHIANLANNQSKQQHDDASLKDVIEMLEDADGVDSETIKKLMGLPDSKDDNALNHMKESSERQIVNDISNAKKMSDRARRQGGSFPGQHMLDAAEIALDINDEPNGVWKHQLFDLLTEDAGLKFIQTDDALNMEYHAGLPLDIGADLRLPESPVYLIIVDSSGSTGPYIDEFFSEAIGMLQEDENGVTPTIHIMSADTTARGVVYTLDEYNKDEIIGEIKAFGGGGTHFESEIRDCYQYILDEEYAPKGIDRILLLTDLEDYIPKREALQEELPPVVFMCPPHLFREDFERGVSDWARVIAMDLDNSYEVDLSEDATEDNQTSYAIKGLSK
jgi:hypothetical protein